MSEPEQAPGLFPVTDAAPGAGPVELGLMKALRAARADRTIIDQDEGLVEAALLCARALDATGRVMGPKTIYAIAQALTPYREALHALRLPAPFVPADAPAPAPSGAVTSSWEDVFGTPE